MRLLVFGGRDYYDKEKVFSTLDAIHAKRGVDSVIEGGCIGADALAAEWAIQRGIDLAECQANWKVHGNAAGPRRNRFMASLLPDGAVAFGGGRGTEGMIKILEERGVKVMEVDR